MKKFDYNGNAELLEKFFEAGFSLQVNEAMEIIVTDEEAEAITKWAEENAFYALHDFWFENVNED